MNMNLKQIQNFIPKNGERFIFIEDGSPKSVLISFDDYCLLRDESSGEVEEKEEPANKPKQQSQVVEDNFSMPSQEKTELTLDDLPF